MNTFTVRSVEVFSSQEWAAYPDMVEVYLDGHLIEKMSKCIAFLRSNQAHMTQIWDAAGYELFQDVENVLGDELNGKEMILGPDDRQFIVFEPEYQISGCHLEVHFDGDVYVKLPFKHSDDTLSANLGKFEQILAAWNAAKTFAQQNSTC